MSNPFFNITPEQIQQLSPEQLRDVIGHLCEAELELAGKPLSFVRYGGHISAKDGGLDIVVDLDTASLSMSFIPRQYSGFQAKATPMGKSQIQKEMEPKLRKGMLFSEIEAKNGAYIIVSSKDNCSHNMLDERIKVMRDLLTQHNISEDVFVDFYDSSLISRWVRQHPAVVLQVHELTGTKLSYWRPHGSWTIVTPETKDAFIIDETKRVKLLNCEYQEEKLSVLDTISFIRSRLNTPGSAVRLIGLSGVGKTRLAEALFDETIGHSPLNKNLVCYAKNFSDVSPSPLIFAENMKLSGKKGYLVIDDCSRENHRELSKLLNGTQISLLTIDHDVKDDLPEQTDVVVLEPSSEDHLIQLLALRFPKIDQETRQQIARLCEGNSRMAFVIADAFLRTNSIGPLADEQLISRIFWQRDQKQTDSTLLKAAETCSLFYSFIGSFEAKNNHLQKLTSFLGLSKIDLVGALADLEERQVLQTRGYWKALLPQALANRIATKALKKVEPMKVIDFFSQIENLDLFPSFCKRMLYLHNSKEAMKIASELLNSPEIWENLNEYSDQAASWLSMINPSAGFKFFERMSQEILEVPYMLEIWIRALTRGLSHLAYFEEFFEKSLTLLEKVIREKVLEKSVYKKKIEEIDYLFSPVYSMTRASKEARLRHIQTLLKSDEPFDVDAGLLYLASALKPTANIRIPLNLGAITPSQGNNPNTKEEWDNWYEHFLGFALSLAESNSELSKRVKEIILLNSQDILQYHLADNLLVDWLLNTSDWKTRLTAWRHLRSVLRRIVKTSNNTQLADLFSLEEKIRPHNIVEESFIFLSTEYYSSYTLLDEFLDSGMEFSESRKKIENRLFQLGADFPSDQSSLSELSEIFFGIRNHEASAFLSGLLSVVPDPLKLWNTCVEIYKNFDDPDKDISFFVYLFDCIHSSYPETIDNILDFMRSDSEFKSLLPHAMLKNQVDDSNINDFLNLISAGKLTSIDYWKLHSIKLGKELSYLNFCQILKKLSANQDGNRIEISILGSQLSEMRENCDSSVLLKTAQDLLYKLDSFTEHTNKGPMFDYYVAMILKVLVHNPYPGKSIEPLIEKLLPRSTRGLVRIRDYQESIDVLAAAYPEHLLNALYKRIGLKDVKENMDLFNEPEQIGLILNKVDRNFLLNWCVTDSYNRALFVARYIPLTENSEERLGWSVFGVEFLNNFYEIPGVLEAVLFRLRPRSWSGDYSVVLESYLPLFESIIEWGGAGLISWADNSLHNLNKEIQQHQAQEIEERLQRNTFY
jgi:hypothetical protein